MQASLSYADGDSKIDLLRIDPDRLEKEISQREGKLPKGTIKRYKDKVKKVRLAQGQAERGELCTFLVIDAKKLRTSNMSKMIAMQELQTTNADWFQEFTLSFADAVQQTWKKSFLAISHRWEKPWHPDPNGNQLRCLVSFLRANEDIKYVWLECVAPMIGLGTPRASAGDGHPHAFARLTIPRAPSPILAVICACLRTSVGRGTRTRWRICALRWSSASFD